MKNPWKNIKLKTYEKHMSVKYVYQLQILNEITKEQLNKYYSSIIAILGVSGGNGLEFIKPLETSKVYGIDINSQYLNNCKKRFPQLDNLLELICCDISEKDYLLPATDLLICNLIIEYLGEDVFINLIKNNTKNVKIISCVIQKSNKNSFVSNSKQASELNSLLTIYKNIEEKKLCKKMEKINFSLLYKQSYLLPNGKEFIRLDFQNMN